MKDTDRIMGKTVWESILKKRNFFVFLQFFFCGIFCMRLDYHPHNDNKIKPLCVTNICIVC